MRVGEEKKAQVDNKKFFLGGAGGPILSLTEITVIILMDYL